MVSALGCAPVTTTGADGSGSSDSSGASSESLEGGTTSASSDTSADATGADASSSSSTGEAPAVCGNGVVEPPEQCDGEPGCEDCVRTCSFAPPITMHLSGVNWTVYTTVPVPLGDGTGDLMVTSASGLHRVAPDGEEQWVQSEPIASAQVLSMTAADADSVWLGWLVDTSAARYARYAVADGAELESFDVGAGNTARPEVVLGAPDGALLVGTTVTNAEDVRFARIDRRDAIGAAVQWSTDLLDDAGRDMYLSRYVLDLAIGADQSVFVAGGVRTDFDTVGNEITALAPDGTLRWRRDLEASALYAGARGLYPLDDGGVVGIVFQEFSDAGIIGNTPAGFTQVVRLDADGNVLWQVDPSEALDEYRASLFALRAVGDRFAIAGALVDDTGNAAAWLGYLDGDGALLCNTAVVPDNADPAAVDAITVAADGSLLVQGFTDDDEPGALATSRWYAPVYPY